VRQDTDVAVKAKEFTYAVGLDRTGDVSADGTVLRLEEQWTPEHLVLAGLIRCSLESLRYHAQRVGIDDLVASGRATARVTKRDSDARYAFVEIDVELEVELEPEPDDLAALVAKAERDCFIGASLTTKPTYRWRVNGGDVSG
jgi:uncharacterized OsmC-like protein